MLFFGNRKHLVLNQDFQDFEDYSGRLWFGCYVDSYSSTFLPFFCRDAMLRVFSPKVFNLNLPLALGLESGFTGF
jgi:hypothetical protein